MMADDTHPIPSVVDTTASPYAVWRTLPTQNVVIDSGFWAKKQQTNHITSLQHGYRMLEKAGNFHNLRLAAGLAEGDYRGRNFMDSDVYKWLEAVGHELSSNSNTELHKLADEAIDLVVAAQLDDGYINSYYQTVCPDMRWTDLDHGHELYCAGHLIQAAIAFHRTTGDIRLLQTAQRFADHIDTVFGRNARAGAPGHPEIEMALLELYRHTRERCYLELAQFFLDERGKGVMRGLGRYGPEYHQDRVPIREASIVEGHAVRALYLMAGAADLYLETGEQPLLDAIVRQWCDMVDRKLFITGGVGARHEGESFGDPYELPNDQCYCETCAAAASIMWNWRLLLISGEGRYADLIERTLLNGFLSGVSIAGDKFFYVNPLSTQGKHERQPWFEVACCPPNVMRLIASFGHYVATTAKSSLQIHQYAAASIRAKLDSGPEVAVAIKTDYPWDGSVKLEIAEANAARWKLMLRIPAWCEHPSIRVNGQPQAIAPDRGYSSLERIWHRGDIVELDLPMASRLVEGNPRVDATRGSVAVERGPMIYCLESCDLVQPLNIFDVRIAADAQFEDLLVEDQLGGSVLLETSGYILDNEHWQNHLYRPVERGNNRSRQSVRLRFVPYHLWSNRESGPMRVWIPRG